MVKTRLILLIAMSFVGTACDIPDRVTSLEKQSKELKEEINKRQAAVDYDLQEKCSRDSKAWFKENWVRDKETILLDYENHYNRNLNKCFISVEFHYYLGTHGSWINDISLWDVYENMKYASFSEHHDVNFPSRAGNEDKVDACDVASQKCSSIDEYNKLSGPYLSN